MTTKQTFTHPDDAPEGHEWVDEAGHPVHLYEEVEGLFCGRLKDSSGWIMQYYGPNHTLRDAPKEYTFTGWVNVYAHRLSGTFLERKTADTADSLVPHKRIACKEVTITVRDGEGLEESE